MSWSISCLAFTILVFLISCWCILNQHYNPTSSYSTMAVLKISWLEFFNSLSEIEFVNCLMICSGWFDIEWILSSLSLGFLHGKWVLFCRFSEMWMSILKNQTHVKVGNTSEFSFGIYWWTFKYKKKLRTLKKWKEEKKLLEISLFHT